MQESFEKVYDGDTDTAGTTYAFSETEVENR